MDGSIILIVVLIIVVLSWKWVWNNESTSSKKERERLKISEEDYLNAPKSLKSSLLTREQQEEQIRRYKFEQTKARILNEVEERNRKLKEDPKE